MCVCLHPHGAAQLISIHQQQRLLWYLWLLRAHEAVSCVCGGYCSLPQASGRPRRPPDEGTGGSRHDVFTEELFKVTSGTVAHVASGNVLGHLHAVQIHKGTRMFLRSHPGVRTCQPYIWLLINTRRWQVFYNKVHKIFINLAIFGAYALRFLWVV